MAAGVVPAVHYNLPSWIEDNKKYFLPPVCNKMMHGDGQLKVFYVGGPNQRKDFHLEEGEEFFYQLKGDMKLVVLEAGNFRDVVIKQGEVFQLPGKIPHSPQRYQDTVGLVIERERMKSELDCLRYFMDGSTETLWERWFYCEDLGVQLGPVIKEYFASEQHKTRKPIPGTISKDQPWVPDSTRLLQEPFPLATWLNKNRAEIQQEGSKRLFDMSYQSDVEVLGAGTSQHCRPGMETWLWQLEGESEVEVGEEKISLVPQDSLLVHASTPYTLTRSPNALTLSLVMDTSNKGRGFAHTKEEQKKKDT